MKINYERILNTLKKEVETVREDKIEEQAIEMLDDEDYRDEEEMQEAVEENIGLIENGGHHNDDMQWECGYARGYEVAMQDIIKRLNG